MNPFQPWQDTISLLAGASPPRSTRLGEQFETPPKPRRLKRVRTFVHAQAMRLLLIVRVTPH